MKQRRSFVMVGRTLVLAVVGSVALLPGTAGARPAGGSPSAVESVVSAAATLIPRLDGSLEVIRGDQREVLTLADGAQVTNLSPAPAPEPEPEESTLYLCFDSKFDPANNPKRMMYPPVAVAGEAGMGHIQYVFTLFRLDEARRYGNLATRQYELCGRGLGSSDAERWKMQYAGATEADLGTVFSRIGWEFKTGETPPKYSLTYGFARGAQLCAGVPTAKACADSSISASIEQVKSGMLTGGFKAPTGQLQSAWQNGVAGWWDGKQVGGAPDHESHGTVLHALWEYPKDEPRSEAPLLFAEVYAKFTCTRWLGIGCDVEPS